MDASLFIFDHRAPASRLSSPPLFLTQPASVPLPVKAEELKRQIELEGTQTGAVRYFPWVFLIRVSSRLVTGAPPVTRSRSVGATRTDSLSCQDGHNQIAGLHWSQLRVMFTTVQGIDRSVNFWQKNQNL